MFFFYRSTCRSTDMSCADPLPIQQKNFSCRSTCRSKNFLKSYRSTYRSTDFSYRSTCRSKNFFEILPIHLPIQKKFFLPIHLPIHTGSNDVDRWIGKKKDTAYHATCTCDMPCYADRIFGSMAAW